MRIAKVIGTITISRQIPGLKHGRYLIVDAMDGKWLHDMTGRGRREKPMPESLIVFDELGAGMGQMIAVSEGREACMPFHPTPVPYDAYNAAILDQIDVQETQPGRVG